VGSKEDCEERSKGEMSDTKSELHGIVLSTVRELEAAASGTLYRCGSDWKIIDDIDDWKEKQYQKCVEIFRKEHPEDAFSGDDEGFDTYEEYMEDEIGTVDDIDDPEEVSLSEYIEDQSLGDVMFEVDEDLDLRGGKVLFCCGGPTVWVHDDQVCGYWGCDTVEMGLDSETRNKLYAWFKELWSTKKERMGWDGRQ
jgi:hypothetical protein